MPRGIDAFSFNNKLTSDPTRQLNFKPDAYYRSFDEIIEMIGSAGLFSLLGSLDATFGTTFVNCAKAIGFKAPDQLGFVTGMNQELPSPIGELKKFFNALALDIREGQQFTVNQIRQGTANAIYNIRGMLSPSDFQKLLDSASNIFGHPGPGNSVDDLLAYIRQNGNSTFGEGMAYFAATTIDSMIQVGAVPGLPPPDIHALLGVIDLVGMNFTGLLRDWAEQAFGNWEKLFEQLGLDEANADYLAAWLTGVDTKSEAAHELAVQAQNNWMQLLLSLGFDSPSANALADWLSGVKNKADATHELAVVNQNNWMQLFVRLGLPQLDSVALADFLSGANDLATVSHEIAVAAESHWNDLFISLGLSDNQSATLADWLSGVSNTAQYGHDQLNALFIGLGFTAEGAEQVAGWLTGIHTTAQDADALAQQAFDRWDALFVAIGFDDGTAQMFASWLTGIKTNADQAHAATGTNADWWTQLVNALTGGPNLSPDTANDPGTNWLSNIWNAFTNFPNTNVQASHVGGFDLGDSIQQFLDTIFNASTDTTNSGMNINDVGDAVAGHKNRTDEAHDLGTTATNTLSIRNNKQSFVGLDDTSVSNMPLPAGTSLYQCTSNYSWLTFIRIPEVDDKTSVSMMLRQVGTPTAYVVVYKLNFDTQTLERVTGQAVSGLNTSAASWFIVPLNPKLHVEPGDVIAVEIGCAGAPSVNGLTSPGQAAVVPTHPIAKLKNIIASRTGVTSVPTGNMPLSAFTWGIVGDGLKLAGIPYVSLESGGIPNIPHTPVTGKYTVNNTYDINVPDWATHVQPVAVGGAGGGGGGLWGGFDPTGVQNQGGPGGDTIIQLKASNGTVLHTITGLHGAGAPSGTVGTVSQAYGHSPGTATGLDDQRYVGGAQVSYQRNGLSPGSGGGGGEFMNFYGYGGDAGKFSPFAEYSLDNVATIHIIIGQGGLPNDGGGQHPISGQGSWGAGHGGRGAAWLRFLDRGTP